MLHRKGFNLKCLSRDPGVLWRAARFTTGYVRLVAQEPAPSKCVLLSTSREVRSDMKDWVLSDSGDQWSVKFDVRDLGGHLDTTFRGWYSTLAARVRLVISRFFLIFVFPLDFHVGFVSFGPCIFLLLCMVSNLLCLPLTVCGSFGPLSAGWSGHDVNLRLVLGLCLVCLMGQLGATPLCVWYGSGLGCFVGRLVGFIAFWGWLAMVALLQLVFVVGLVLGVVLFWIFMALCSCLILFMFGKEIRLCFVASWLVVSGTVFSLGRLGGTC